MKQRQQIALKDVFGGKIATFQSPKTVKFDMCAHTSPLNMGHVQVEIPD